eukprot:CAMPEP_0198223220 /NCGR_PEP_ID=MMETSP1445-20131203/91625_1 /TAXON_ID=36898 /ORGANISM="Pyramimonas sp., Strain CCMP2087" /LENGTH=238 /DNA_ID=CAMNT_0043902001 /DNA_START=934 /DNA_END=1646 /DNA_ORIENTATION=+
MQRQPHMQALGRSTPLQIADEIETTGCQVFTEDKCGKVEPAAFEKSVFMSITEDGSKLVDTVGISYIKTSETLSLIISDSRRDPNSSDLANNEESARKLPQVLFGRSPIDPIVKMQQMGVPWSHPSCPFVKLAVVVLVENDAGHILLTRRARRMRSFPGAWVLPGGHVDDADTSLEAAACREVEEETGLILLKETLELVGCWESSFPAAEVCLALAPPRAAHHAIMLCYHATAAPASV